MVVQTKVGSATATAVKSMLVLGASQKPRKITLPVMLATKTWPRTRMLIESANPVAKVSNNSANTVDRSDIGEVMAMGAEPFGSLQLRLYIQRRDRRHPGHQPAIVRAFHEQPVRQVFQRRDVLAQWTLRRRVGVHDDDSIRVVQRFDRRAGDLGAVGHLRLLVGCHDRVDEFAI